MARCTARLMYGGEEQTVCSIPCPAYERFCPAHHEEHRAASSTLGAAKAAVDEARLQADAMMRRLDAGRTIVQKAMIADGQSYLAALDDLLKEEETHQQRFGCKGECHWAPRLSPICRSFLPSYLSTYQLLCPFSPHIMMNRFCLRLGTRS